MKKETFRTILIVVGVLVLLAIVGLGSAAWLFMRGFETSQADAASATETFDDVRNRFAGTSPVLVIEDDRPTVARKPPAQSNGVRLTALRILVWDPEDERVARIELPFWLLRLKSGPIEIAADRDWMEETELGLTIEELERYGSTLVLDHQARDGARLIVWTE
jgi:hypothetical protein